MKLDSANVFFFESDSLQVIENALAVLLLQIQRPVLEDGHVLDLAISSHLVVVIVDVQHDALVQVLRDRVILPDPDFSHQQKQAEQHADEPGVKHEQVLLHEHFDLAELGQLNSIRKHPDLAVLVIELGREHVSIVVFKRLYLNVELVFVAEHLLQLPLDVLVVQRRVFRSVPRGPSTCLVADIAPVVLGEQVQSVPVHVRLELTADLFIHTNLLVEQVVRFVAADDESIAAARIDRARNAVVFLGDLAPVAVLDISNEFVLFGLMDEKHDDDYLRSGRV